MSPVRRPAGRLACAVVAAVVTVAVCLVATGSPAQAVHQNCGANYPEGTLPNGHPDLSAGANIGWAGQVSLNTIDAAVFGVSSTKTILLDTAGVISGSADILDSTAEQLRKVLIEPVESAVAAPIEAAAEVLSVVATTLVFAALATLIAETALKATQRARAGAVGAENACNAVLAGDMLDQIWVATVERNLASDGPALAMLMIPTDSSEAGGDSGEWPIQPQHEQEDFAWCPQISLPEELPAPAGETDLSQPNGPSAGGDCTPAILDGFLNEPYDDAPRVTVQAIVRDAIDHASAHGLPVRAAETHYDDAVAALGQGRYKEAFQHFRLAYQAAAGFDG